MDSQFFLDNLWRWKCGLPELDEAPQAKEKMNIDELRKTEWSKEFEERMRNRLVMGAFRYGKLGASGKRKFDRVGDSIRRLEAYIETGNQEYLVDVANLCLAEYVEGNHPKAHFASVDDGGHAPEVDDK